MKYFGLVVFLCILALDSRGQVRDNRNCNWTKTSIINLPYSTILDPSSIKVMGASDSLYFFNYDPVAKSISVALPPSFKDSVLVCYRVVGVPTSWVHNRTLNEYDSAAKFKGYEQLLQGDPLFVKRSKLIETGNVQTGGRLSRGFSMGTNQDMFMNSSLNLTMDGKLSSAHGCSKLSK